MEESAIISAIDVDNIYKIPRLLHEQGLDEIVVKKFGIDAQAVDLKEWDAVVDAMEHQQAEVNIAMVGKYMDLTDSYKSLSEALFHAGIQTRTKVNIIYVDSEEIEQSGQSTFPRRIFDTDYWVMTNTDTSQKKDMLQRVLETLGYTARAIQRARRALD